LLLIAVGVIVLLANTGVLSQGALQRLGDLWPLLLVIFGLQLVLNHSLPRQQATLAGLAATAVIAAAAIVYAALAPEQGLGTQQADTSAPLSGLKAGTLDLSYGAASIEVGSATLGDRLYQLHAIYPGGENPPDVSLDPQSGTVSINQGGGFSPFHLFGGRRRLQVFLSNRIPWTIQIGGGASSVHLDLRELQLAGIEISGGANSVDVQLGKPKGTVPIQLSGGASNLTIHAAAGSEWSVSLSGGVSGVTINGASLGAFGGDVHRESGGYGKAADRFEIQVSGGVSHLDLRTG
jgi:hypothetical protein